MALSRRGVLFTFFRFFVRSVLIATGAMLA